MNFFTNQLIVCLVALLHVLLPVYAAPPAYNLQLGVVNEDFSSGGDETYTQLTASVRYAKGLKRNSVINLNADIFTRDNSDNQDKDTNGLLAEVIYSYIPTGGFRKPVYSLGLRIEEDSSDFIFNDFTRVSLFLADTLRIDDKTTITFGVEMSRKKLEDRDTDVIGLFLNTDFQMNDKFLIYLNLKYQDEDNEAKATSISAITNDALAARSDFAAHHEGSVASPSVSLPGSDNTYITLGANYFIDAHNAIDVSYERREYSLSDGLDLTGNLLSIDYFYKF